MRQAMAESVASFKADGYGHLPDVPGDLGLTAQFIATVSPSQAIISGTSSFRLDKLALYLSDRGPKYYFGSETSFSEADARRFADALLQEILGSYTPPDIAYEDQQQYVAAALSTRANRSRADAIYLGHLKEIGIMWGTLIGVKAYTRGESFVARNVGLSSVWEDGEWKVKIIFMDHDAMGIAEPNDADFTPDDTFYGQQLDETYLWGRGALLGTVGHLRRLYQVSDAVYQRGLQLARAEAKKAYERTHRTLLTDPALRGFFSKAFLERLEKWEVLVNAFLHARLNGGVDDAWKAQRKKNGDKKTQNWFDKHIKAMENYTPFLERQSFLFSPRA
jgi:hypothetical protein